MAEQEIAEVDDQTWAHQTARTAREFLDAGQPLEALELMHSRSNRIVRLALLTLEVEALATAEEMDEALSVIKAGMEIAAEDEQSSTYLEVALLGARIAEDAGLFAVALDLAERARSAAGTSGDQIGALSADVVGLRLHRRSGSDPDSVTQLRAQVIEESQRLRRSEWSRYPSLLRDSAAEVGDAAPPLVVDAAHFAGVDIEGDAGRILADLVPSDQIISFTSYAQDVADMELDAVQSEQPNIQQSFSGQPVTEQGQRLSAFLKREEDVSPEWNEALVQVYRNEVDKSAF
jgi:hypothetical protein